MQFGIVYKNNGKRGGEDGHMNILGKSECNKCNILLLQYNIIIDNV